MDNGDQEPCPMCVMPSANPCEWHRRRAMVVILSIIAIAGLIGFWIGRFGVLHTP